MTQECGTTAERRIVVVHSTGERSGLVEAYSRRAALLVACSQMGVAVAAALMAAAVDIV